MLISPQLARDTLADLIKDCGLPLDAGELIPGKGEFLAHGHVFVGDVAVRGYKDKGRWRYDDRDIRRAGRHLASVVIDSADLVEAGFPDRRWFDVRGTFDDMSGADWRGTLNHWAYAAAHRSLLLERDGPAAVGFNPADDFDLLDPELSIDIDVDIWSSSRYEIGPHGLPGQLTFNEFVSYYGKRTIAGTRPLEVLAWSGTHWVFPRAYRDMLDHWQAQDRELSERARICSDCGRRGSGWSWRTPTAGGYVTMCPSCSDEAFQTYTGHLHGVAYTSLRRTHRADAYLCCLCRESRAFTWDHCHEHGFVRGPVCASCNTFEGKGVPFLRRDGSVEHLLACRGCREASTLPRRFHLDVALAHLEADKGHGHCRPRPYAELRETDGVHHITLSCPAHASTAKWTTEVTVAEVVGIVRAFVDSTLASPGRYMGLQAGLQTGP
ncbi:endonuclease domain-containing protein [Streptomyces sp. NPDC088794]|uniref:endonuclease domain-containing protein n=1 Tax=Streptomyces sp. NPDC088794 TaxID=3365902 RepID=UPI003802A844